jgi:hypothetical protein
VGSALISPASDGSYSVESNFHVLRTSADGTVVTYPHPLPRNGGYKLFEQSRQPAARKKTQAEMQAELELSIRGRVGSLPTRAAIAVGVRAGVSPLISINKVNCFKDF